MATANHEPLISVRQALGAFAVMVAFVNLFPGVAPAGFEHLTPGSEDMSPVFTVAHHLGNVLLGICAVWLMSGQCRLGASLMAVALFSFYVYLVRVGFEPSLGALLGFSVLVVLLLGYVAWKSALLVWPVVYYRRKASKRRLSPGGS